MLCTISARRVLFAPALPSSTIARMSAAGEARVCRTCPRRDWRRLAVPDGYLRLSLTLPGGQSFRWRDLGQVTWAAQDAMYREWAGVLSDRLVVMRQRDVEAPIGDPEVLYYRLEPAMGAAAALDAFEPELLDFLQIDFDLRPVVEKFCRADNNFRRLFPHYRGARLLRQPPVECFFAFICSSNNNIKRITTMVTHIAEAYGELVGEYRGQKYFAFPRVSQIAKLAREDDLREAGFGYRAKFIVESAKMLVRISQEKGVSPEKYLMGLRKKGRMEVAEELTVFPGIGRKVAGCIALMSLDQLGEIPCDTHVWQIAMRYMPSLKAKSLTPKVYESVGNFFRDKFGDAYAGIAHNTLFIAELADFKDRASGGSKSQPSAANAPRKKEVVKKGKRKSKAMEARASGDRDGVKLKLRLKIESKEEREFGLVKAEDVLMTLPKKKIRRVVREPSKIDEVESVEE